MAFDIQYLPVVYNCFLEWSFFYAWFLESHGSRHIQLWTMGTFWICSIHLSLAQTLFWFVELITIPHESRGKIHGWHQPNVPGISGLGLIVYMACLYAPIIMDQDPQCQLFHLKSEELKRRCVTTPNTKLSFCQTLCHLRLGTLPCFVSRADHLVSSYLQNIQTPQHTHQRKSNKSKVTFEIKLF
jgi:hypothetical protein